MKRNVKKGCSILLVILLLLAAVAGCGKKEEKKEEPKQEASKPEETDQKKADSENSNQEGSDQSDPKESDSKGAQKGEQQSSSTETGLPLCEEKQTLTYWCTWSNAYLNSPDEVLSVQEMERRTNVHIDWTCINRNEVTEKFGLMLASGNLCDIISSYPASYPGSYMAGIEDGLLMDCADLVEQYMPNYRAWLDQNPLLLREAQEEDGRIHCLTSLQGNDEGIRSENDWTGLCVRKDWLDELNLEIPETIEEWYDVLIAFRDQKNATAPLSVGQYGYGQGCAFMTAFDTGSGMIVKDGVVKYGPLEEGYKQWIELFRQWYAEGLIDPNFISVGNFGAIKVPEEYITNNSSGAFNTMWTLCKDVYYQQGYSQDADINVIAVQAPVQNKGDSPKVMPYVSAGNGMASATYISANCSNPELVAKWLDYQYSVEGMELNFYGIEDETYYKDEAGNYHYTDLILKNPDYSATDAQKLYVLNPSALGYYNWQREEHCMKDGEELAKFKNVWTDQDTSMGYYAGGPSAVASMSQADAEEYSRLMTAIETLVNESTVKFIMGTESMEQYDTFVKNLYDYGIERCIELSQKVYDKYH